MPNCYASREQFKRALGVAGAQYDTTIDRLLESASRELDNAIRRNYIPYTDTKLYRWPPYAPSATWTLWLDADLLSVSALSAGGVAITSYFLEPQQFGPPYTRIEIDLSSTAAFQSGNTPQRAVSVAGDWGTANGTRPYSATKAAGVLANAGAVSSGATTFTVGDASLIDVDETLLIESERMFVQERSLADTGATLNGTIDSANTTTAVTVSDGTKVHQGETISVDSEQMLVVAIVGNVLTVQRPFNGTAIAQHSNGAHVYAGRTLSVQRGVNGTTAASHADLTAIAKYVVKANVALTCLGSAITKFEQEKTGWGRNVGQGDMAAEANQHVFKWNFEETVATEARERVTAI